MRWILYIALASGLLCVVVVTAFLIANGPARNAELREDRDRCLVLAGLQDLEIRELREANEEMRKVLRANGLVGAAK